MAERSVWITTELSRLEEKVDVSAIPGITNQNYMVNIDPKDSARGLFVFKADDTCSILEMLDMAEQYLLDEDAIIQTRNYYWQLQREAQMLAMNSKNEAYAQMLNCFTERTFTGIVLCGLGITVKNGEAFAPRPLVQKAVFRAPLLLVTGVRLDGDRADVSGGELYGRIAGVLERQFYDEAQTFRFVLEEIDILVRREEILFSDLRCKLCINRLFSSTAYMDEMPLCGIYQQLSGVVSGSRAYALASNAGTVIALCGGCIQSLSLDGMVSRMDMEGQELRIQLECSGKLYFSVLPGAYDLFSYGQDADDVVDHGLRYTGLVLRLKLVEEASAMEMDVTKLALTEEGCCARAGSFAEQMAHAQIGFCSWQNGISPEKLRYVRILTPFPQKRLGDEWYGMTMKIPLFRGITMELLIAFDGDKLYLGGRMGENGGSSFLMIPTGSPFRVQTGSIVLDVREEESGRRYGLIFKGLKLLMFGLTMPEGNCNLMLSQDAQGNSSWYAVYGNRKEE